MIPDKNITPPPDSSPPSSALPSPQSTTTTDETKLFLAFVRQRNVPCPRCGHNLRPATQMKCVECGDALNLAVSAEPLILRWFLIVITPGIFSGILAGIMAVLVVTQPGAPPPVYGFLVLGFLSGLVAMGICLFRKRFLRLTLAMQIGTAAIIWFSHLALFYFTVWLPLL